MMEKYWNLIVSINFASGHAHSHTEDSDFGMLEIIDDFGVHGIWVYDKKKQEITLKGA